MNKSPGISFITILSGISLCLAATADSAMIDFEEVQGSDVIFGLNTGAPYLTPQGFLFQNYDASHAPIFVRIWDATAVVGNPNAMPTHGLINTQFNGTTVMTDNDGSAFNVASFDLGSSFVRS